MEWRVVGRCWRQAIFLYDCSQVCFTPLSVSNTRLGVSHTRPGVTNTRLGVTLNPEALEQEAQADLHGFKDQLCLTLARVFLNRAMMHLTLALVCPTFSQVCLTLVVCG